MQSRVVEKALGVLMSVALLAAPAASAGTAPAKKKTNDALVLATVNEEPVTAGDLLTLFKDRHSGHSSFLGGPQEAKSFLNIVIDDRLLMQEAYNLGLDEEKELVRILGDYADRTAQEAFIQQETVDKSKPTKEEIEAAWKNLDLVLQARQIAVPTAQEAEEIRAALLRGADAESFARKCSGARSSRNGGNIMVSWGQFPPEWEAAVMPLQPGDVSPVIKTTDAYEVVMIVNRVEVPRPEFKEVSERIGTILELRKKARLQDELSQYLWERYQAKIVLEDLSPVALLRLLEEKPDAIVATWANDGKLTLADTFEKDELRQIIGQPAARANYEVDLRIRTTVNSPLSILEARARKVADQPEVATKIDDYREFLMRNMLFRDHIFRDVTPTPEALQKYYDDHLKDFEEQKQYHVAQIVVASEKDAKDVRAKLDGGADFTAMVEKHSKDMVSAAAGGDLGWITPDKVPAMFAEVMQLPVGGVTKPIQNTTGAWHLIKLLETKPQRTPPFADIKDKVEKAAIEAAKREQRGLWVTKLRAASAIAVDEAAIKQFVEEHKDDGEAPPQHALQ